MKVNLTGTAGVVFMLALLAVKLAFWVGLFYVAQHFVIKFW